jgi:hypothetical protein
MSCTWSMSDRSRRPLRSRLSCRSSTSTSAPALCDNRHDLAPTPWRLQGKAPGKKPPPTNDLGSYVMPPYVPNAVRTRGRTIAKPPGHVSGNRERWSGGVHHRVTESTEENRAKNAKGKGLHFVLLCDLCDSVVNIF